MEQSTVVTVEELRDFLGVDAEHDPEIAALRAYALESIRTATKIRWEEHPNKETYNEAARVKVWLSYYAVRDAAKNTQFILDYLDGLLCSLQLCTREVETT